MCVCVFVCVSARVSACMSARVCVLQLVKEGAGGGRELRGLDAEVHHLCFSICM